MFEVIEGLGNDVIALRAVGKVSASDYTNVLDPAVAKATAGGRKARLLLELGPEFEGYEPAAMVADTKLGIASFNSFSKIGVVTDNDWISHAVRLLGVLMPGEVRVFATEADKDARSWIASKSET